MSASPSPPIRLASEDVIINAPMSYAGSAQRILRLRRLAHSPGPTVAITILAIVLVLLAWALVTVWYFFWGLWLVPYRVLRRGARKRKAEALRHRELMGTIQGSAAASAVALVTATTSERVLLSAPPRDESHIRIDSNEREQALATLRSHYLAGRLTEDEFDERVEHAHAARTRGDLETLMFDLPALPAGTDGSADV